MASKKTLQSKFVNALLAGRELTVKQVRALGFANPYDAAYKVRQAGHALFTNERTLKSGQRVSAYRMSKKGIESLSRTVA